MAFVLIFVVAALIAYLYYQKECRVNKALEHFVKPPEVPLLGHALSFLYKNHLEVLTKYIKKYGDSVHLKIGPKRHMLFTTNYDLIKFVLTSPKLLNKSLDYKNLNRWLGTGLATAAESKWKKHRAIISPTFDYKILEKFVEVFEKNGDILCKQIDLTLTEIPINIYPFISRCTLDIICESAMGTSVNAQEDRESEYVRSCNVMCEIIVERAFSPHKVFDSLYYFTEDYKRESNALKILHGYSRKVIQKRQESMEQSTTPTNSYEKTKKAFLDHLLSANEQNQTLTLDEICQEVDTFMFAGHHTSASAICFVLYLLAQHADVQERVFNEQLDIFNDNFTGLTINLQHLKSMKYLELVIKESLRLYPSAPLFAREVTENVSFNGKTLPKGLTIAMFVYELHRNPKYFKDPETFNPNRFEENNHEPFAYLPFSAGSRNCIGHKFAMPEIKSIVSKIVRQYHILPDPSHKLKVLLEIVLSSSSGFNLTSRLKKRNL